MSAPLLLQASGDRAGLAATLQQAWQRGRTVAIAAPEEAALLQGALPEPEAHHGLDQRAAARGDRKSVV